jgi:hypothetical protein
LRVNAVVRAVAARAASLGGLLGWIPASGTGEWS